MKKRVLILHGWESNSKEHWFLEEKQRLEKLNYEVIVPDMPNTLHPKKEEWIEVVEDFAPDDNSILIGHSLGGVTILRYLERLNKKIPKCILIATPIRRLEKSDYDFSPINDFFEPEFNWEKIKENCKEFIIINQTEDNWIPFQHGKDLASYLDGKLKVVKGDNHFDTIDFSLLEQYILD